MEWITIISILAAISTIGATAYAIFRKSKKSWNEIQAKVDNLSQLMHVNQRVHVKEDVTIAGDGKLRTIHKGEQVEVLSINTGNGMVKIRVFDGMLSTYTNIDNLVVDE